MAKTEEVTQTFFDRIEKAVTRRMDEGSNSSSNPPPHTSLVDVASKNKGEMILFAKGYFLSTKDHLGRSRCKRYLPTGLPYSFGVERNGQPIFDQIRYSLPHPQPIKLAV